MATDLARFPTIIQSRPLAITKDGDGVRGYRAPPRVREASGVLPDNRLQLGRRRADQDLLIGGRRHVVLSSYSELVERLITEQHGTKRVRQIPVRATRHRHPRYPTAAGTRGPAIGRMTRAGGKSAPHWRGGHRRFVCAKEEPPYNALEGARQPMLRCCAVKAWSSGNHEVAGPRGFAKFSRN